MLARKVVPVLLAPKEIGDQKVHRAQRVMLARKVLPVLLDLKEIGDQKVHRVQRVMLERQHKLHSGLLGVIAALLPAQITKFWFH